MSAPEQDPMVVGIAQIIDHPSVYMGGPSRNSLRIAAAIVKEFGSDLCASGQQVRALEWEPSKTSYTQANCVLGQYQISFLSEFECWQLSAPPKRGTYWKDGFSRHASKSAAKAAAQAHYERRILSALTPAPQPEGQDALKISPEYQALFDEVKQRAQPEGQAQRLSEAIRRACDLLAERSYGSPARSPAHNARLVLEAALAHATPTAQEAVPTCFACEDNPKHPNIPCAVCGARPPQPSETVAEALENMMSFARSKMDDPSRADDMRIFKDAEAALRALKGGDA